MNPARGYLYDPAGASPEAAVRKVFSRSFSKSADSGGFVCGPKLAYVRGSVEVKTDTIIHEQGFDTKLLADGWILLKSGPRADSTDFGAGQCGACPRAELQVYAISPMGEMTTALNIDQLVGNETDAADFEFAADWSRATYYSKPANGQRWIATSYCLNGHSYQPCGRSENGTPPDPPVVKELR
jgi:hypothetical protein